jgi:p24 family protein beta-1
MLAFFTPFADHLSPLENSILLLSDGLHSVEEEQEYMKLRESVHRDTAESTNSRVMWYSLLEVWVLIALNVFQLYYLKRDFEVKMRI